LRFYPLIQYTFNIPVSISKPTTQSVLLNCLSFKDEGFVLTARSELAVKDTVLRVYTACRMLFGV